MSASVVPHPSSPQPMLVDPPAYLERRHEPEDDIREGVHALLDALALAFNRRDLDAILRLRKRIARCVEALAIVERTALDLMDRTERPSSQEAK